MANNGDLPAIARAAQREMMGLPATRSDQSL
jgi:hypothetical protein